MVDSKGIEPSTLRMRTVRSPKLSYEPEYKIEYLVCELHASHRCHRTELWVL